MLIVIVFNSILPKSYAHQSTAINNHLVSTIPVFVIVCHSASEKSI